MATREDDIQELCRQVLDELLLDLDSNNGNYHCPFCGSSTTTGNINKIKHDATCAYVLAKDLSTK